MSQGSTRARVLHWFVRGGVLRLPDGTSVPVEVDPIVIGRDEGAHVRLEDPEVSALHCELRAVDQGILVKDLGSTNGTFSGNVRIREAVITKPGELTVGQTRIVIEPQTAKQKVDVGYSDRFGDLVGQSPKMRRVFGVLEKVAATPLSILIPRRDRHRQRGGREERASCKYPQEGAVRRRRLRIDPGQPRGEPALRP